MNWTAIEPGVYLITACLPSFRPFFALFVPRFWARISASKASKNADWSTSGRDKRERFQRLGEDGTPLPRWNDSVTNLTSDFSGISPAKTNKSLPLVGWRDAEASLVPPSSAILKDQSSPDANAGKVEEGRIDKESLDTTIK